MRLYPVPAGAAGRLSLCECPDPDHLQRDARTLADCGVSVVVSVLPATEERSSGLAGQADALHDCDVSFLRIPIPDFGVPDDNEQATATLRVLADSLSQSTTHVAVHCAAGLGRSPTIVAGLLVLLGTAPEEAWRTVTTARGVRVPETEGQRLWPRRFDVRERQSD